MSPYAWPVIITYVLGYFATERDPSAPPMMPPAPPPPSGPDMIEYR